MTRRSDDGVARLTARLNAPPLSVGPEDNWDDAWACIALGTGPGTSRMQEGSRRGGRKEGGGGKQCRPDVSRRDADRISDSLSHCSTESLTFNVMRMLFLSPKVPARTAVVWCSARARGGEDMS